MPTPLVPLLCPIYSTCTHASKNKCNMQKTATITSEDQILTIINSLFPSKTPHVPFGRGDDCAELRVQSNRLALSTDVFTENQHFRLSYFTPYEVGHKSLTQAVSDLAGAGAIPLGFSLALMVPPYIGAPALTCLLMGLYDAAKKYNIVLSGGDVSLAERLSLCLTVWGENSKADVSAKKSSRPLASTLQDPSNTFTPLSAPPFTSTPSCTSTPSFASIPYSPSFLQRQNALPGDVLFLIGACGLAHVGLRTLEQCGRAGTTVYPNACKMHLMPQAKLAEGTALLSFAMQKNIMTRLSLMDVSDGLIQDIPRLLGTYGAQLTIEEKWIHPELITFSQMHHKEPTLIFLQGGEDYALLGTVPAHLWEQLTCCVPHAQQIGIVTEKQEFTLHGKPFAMKKNDGFDHFQYTKETAHNVRQNVTADLWAHPILQEALAEIITACSIACEGKLLAGFNGNASCKVTLPTHIFSPQKTEPTVKDYILITASGAAKRQLTNEHFSLITADDGTLVVGKKASTESPMHMALYKACPQTQSILHTHPPQLLALGMTTPVNKRLQLPLFEADTYRQKIGWVQKHEPGTQVLAEEVAHRAIEKTAIWMENHGLVVHGNSLVECLALTEELEQLASIQLLHKNTLVKQ